MKALSIRQPWAWLIVRPDLTDPIQRAAAFAAGEIKDIENRTWATKHRGPFLVHAGQTFDMEGYLWVKSRFPKIPLPGVVSENGKNRTLRERSAFREGATR